MSNAREHQIETEPTAGPTAGDPHETRQQRQARLKVERAARKAPTRSPAYDHLTHRELHALRNRLRDEELHVQYWASAVKVRRAALLRSSTDAAPPRNLTRALTKSATSIERLRRLDTLPLDNHELPGLVRIWNTHVDPADETARHELASELATVEARLLELASALRERADDASGQLMARWHESPQLVAELLPDPTRRGLR